MNTRDWLFAAIVYLLCVSLMGNVAQWVQIRDAKQQLAVDLKEREMILENAALVRSDLDRCDQAYRKVRLELDACQAQLRRKPRATPTPRPVPVFERGRRFD